MDINFIVDFSPSGGGRVYQGGAPDDGIATFQTAGRITMLVEMAAGVDALRWVRQGTLKSVLYFGIDDTPQGCLGGRKPGGESGILVGHFSYLTVKERDCDKAFPRSTCVLAPVHTFSTLNALTVPSSLRWYG